MCLWMVPVQCHRSPSTGNKGPEPAVVTVKQTQTAQTVKTTSYVCKHSQAKEQIKPSSARAPLGLMKSIRMTVKMPLNTSTDVAITILGGKLSYSLTALTASSPEPWSLARNLLVKKDICDFAVAGGGSRQYLHRCAKISKGCPNLYVANKCISFVYPGCNKFLKSKHRAGEATKKKIEPEKSENALEQTSSSNQWKGRMRTCLNRHSKGIEYELTWTSSYPTGIDVPKPLRDKFNGELDVKEATISVDRLLPHEATISNAKNVNPL